MDAIVKTMNGLLDELGAEHADLLPCAARLSELAAANSPDLAEAIGRCTRKLGDALDSHIAQEDNVLFPAFSRQSGDEGLVAQFSSEHRDILRLRDELLEAHRSGRAPSELGPIAAQLAEILTSHMNREDMILFPSARNMFA